MPRAGVLATLLTLMVALTTVPVGFAQSPAPSGPLVEIVSDRTLILQGREDSALVRAVVRQPGESLQREAAIEFESSVPEAVRVEKVAGENNLARVVAATDQITSATITARSAGAAPAVATVAIATLAERTHLITRDEFLRTLPSDDTTTLVVLRPTSETLSIAPGDIVLSGDRLGLLNRVVEVSIHEREETITLRLKPASLTEAFEALNVEATAPERNYTASLPVDGEGEGWLDVSSAQQARDAPSPLVPVTLTAEDNASRFRCEAEHAAAKPTFYGAHFEFTASLAPRAVVRIDRRRLERFEIALTGSVELEANAGSIDFPLTTGGTVVCRAISPGYPLAYLPIAGPVGLSPTVALEIGAEAEARLGAGRLGVSGPVLSQETELAMGLAWTASNGFTATRKHSLSDLWFQEKLNVDYHPGGDFMLRLAPYAGVTVAVQPALGPWLRRGRLNLANGEISASGRLEVGQGFGASACAANGVRGCLAACVSVSLDPLRAETDPMVSFLRRISSPPADALGAWLADVNLEVLCIHNVNGHQDRCKGPWRSPVIHGAPTGVGHAQAHDSQAKPMQPRPRRPAQMSLPQPAACTRCCSAAA